MDALFIWLSSLPQAVLYLALGAAAAVENVFPPLPADTVVAFGAFLAARGHAVYLGTFLAAWLGNVAGALAVYVMARRAGSAWRGASHSRFGRRDAARRLRAFYDRWGLVALAASRFLPGARALVPPFAGAIAIPAVRFTVIIAAASALWYGIMTYAAYRVAANWSAIEALVTSLTRDAALAVGLLAVGAAGAWYLKRRARSQRDDRDRAERL